MKLKVILMIVLLLGISIGEIFSRRYKSKRNSSNQGIMPTSDQILKGAYNIALWPLLTRVMKMLIPKGDITKKTYYDRCIDSISAYPNLFKANNAGQFWKELMGFLSYKHKTIEKKWFESWLNTMGRDFSDSEKHCSGLMVNYMILDDKIPQTLKDKIRDTLKTEVKSASETTNDQKNFITSSLSTYKYSKDLGTNPNVYKILNRRRTFNGRRRRGSK